MGDSNKLHSKCAVTADSCVSATQQFAKATCSVIRSGDLLDFGQLLNAFGNT